ncbi:MAG: VOC family protein [Alphaproteobacteria bacterium]|nr:VOC family protein [Alphaproteobacteria bacterium]
MRPGHNLAAYLTIKDAGKAVAFYERAFGAEVVEKHMAEGRDLIMHCELRINGGLVMLADEFPEYGDVKSPQALGGTTFNLYLDLGAPPAVDAQIEKARKEGAAVVMPPEDTFWGARFGMVRDPFGHMWAFSAPLAKG